MSERLHKRRIKVEKTANVPSQPSLQPESRQILLTPSNILSLQRSIGNQAVQRLVSGARTDRIQRLSAGENPVVTGTLVRIQRLGGATGVNFALTNSLNQKLIVKFVQKVKDDPEKSILGTQILQQAGLNAPNVRQATPGDRANLLNGIGAIKKPDQTTQKQINAFRGYINNASYHMMVMDFAGGKTLAAMKQAQGADESLELTEAMNDPQFQSDMGKLLATDAFTGEADRMHLNFLGMSKGKPNFELRVNVGNLIISKANGSYRVIPIDNDFKPEKMSGAYGSQNKIRSLLPAIKSLFRQEVEAIYNEFTRGVKEKPKKPGLLAGIKKHIQYYKNLKQWKAWVTARETFITNVSRSAQQTLTTLLAHGQHWRTRLTAAGTETTNQADAFKIRRRYLRMLHYGLDMRTARKMSGDRAWYKRALTLITIYHFPADKAASIAKDPEHCAEVMKRESQKADKVGKLTEITKL